MKEAFLANTSHEIRPAINAILGYANLLQHKNLDEESKEYVQTIQNACEKLLAIMNDVLKLSKIEAGMIRIESSAFNEGVPELKFNNLFVLVVEDNEINQSLLKHLFKLWQLNYELANNGKEAIDMLKHSTYDLILMDIQMPEMDGFTTARLIREDLSLSTPIIAMTDHALAGEREKCLIYGMDEYIAKPLNEEQLHHLITQFVQISKTAALRNPEF